MEPKKTFTLKDWDDEDKPREKLLAQGKKQLTNAELIAILLRSGMAGKNVLEVAKEVLQSADGSLVALSRMDFKQLCSTKSMGAAKATTLIAALELGWRMQSEIGNQHEVVVNDSSVLFTYMLSKLSNIDHEEFWAIYLNNRNKVIERQRIATGGQTETSVDLRILLRGALECKATTIAVAHNHPSGNLAPSRADQTLTARIDEASRLLGIRLMDHIIIAIDPQGKANYFSFHDAGKI